MRLLLIGLIISTGCVPSPQTNPAKETDPKPQHKEAGTPKEKPRAKLSDLPCVTAFNLDAAYKANPVHADELYKDHEMVVTGFLMEIEALNKTDAVLKLQGQGAYEIVYCVCPRAQAASIVRWKRIAVRGICAGLNKGMLGVRVSEVLTSPDEIAASFAKSGT